MQQAIKLPEVIETNTIIKKPSINTNSSHKTIDINSDILIKKGYLSFKNDKSNFNEQYRQIKRTIIDKAFGSINTPKKAINSNLVMVTSPNKGEGKTFVALNLALSSVLEKEKTVLLIDANVINPALHKELGFEANNGLIEFLLGQVNDISDVIYNTSIENLKVIPAGKPHYLTNEMLASDTMKELTKQLASRYPDRLVIIDSPEVNSITETPILASQVGQVLLVVESNKTSISDVKQAKAKLSSENDIGIVVNKRIE